MFLLRDFFFALSAAILVFCIEPGKERADGIGRNFDLLRYPSKLHPIPAQSQDSVLDFVRHKRFLLLYGENKPHLGGIYPKNDKKKKPIRAGFPDRRLHIYSVLLTLYSVLSVSLFSSFFLESCLMIWSVPVAVRPLAPPTKIAEKMLSAGMIPGTA